jgi:hypothetical protein
VSESVTPVIAGSTIVFEDRSEYELKGVPGIGRLYAARDGAAVTHHVQRLLSRLGPHCACVHSSTCCA